MNQNAPQARPRSISAPAIMSTSSRPVVLRPCYDRFVHFCDVRAVDLASFGEVMNYLMGLEEQVTRDRSNSWDHAIHHFRGQLAKSGDQDDQRFLLALRDMFYFLEQRFPQPLALIPAEVLHLLSQPVCSTLNQWSRFSCNNAATYMAEYGNADLFYTIMNRSAYVDAPTYSATTTNPLMSGKGFNPMARDDDGFNCFTDRQLKAAFEGLVAAKSGECISFSLAALHVLVTACESGQLPRVTRIELVSMGSGGSGHTFIVVNRSLGGGYGAQTGKLQKHRTMPRNVDWTGDFIIIDPWMGAMGHAVFCGSRTDYLGGDFVCDYFWAAK